MIRVAGVDGCRGGWFVVIANADTEKISDFLFVKEISDIFLQSYKLDVIAVDIPIGLLTAAKPGGRNCDILARKLLGHPRSSSVFSPPVRDALKYADSYINASNANRQSSSKKIGISKQCFGILPKIIEVDRLMSPNLQEIIKEVHPELSFWKMGGETPLLYSKRVGKGRQERINLLSRVGHNNIHSVFNNYSRSEVDVNDIIDAAAACWTAIRIFKGNATRLPSIPEKDANGLLMENWV